MSEWKLKRFWTSADASELDGGFTVTLDGRSVKTPAKQTLVVPTLQLAEALAAEWDAQQDEIDPEDMPLTRLSNSALDKVTTQHAAVADLLAEYGDSDLLCYRAERPQELIDLQTQAWDPLLDWARETLSVSLVTQIGVMPIEQPQASRDIFSQRTSALSAFELTAFHELVSLSGSWVIGYSALTNAHPAEPLWDATMVDEYWQEKQWGVDEDAQAAREIKRAAFLTAKAFADFCRSG